MRRLALLLLIVLSLPVAATDPGPATDYPPYTSTVLIGIYPQADPSADWSAEPQPNGVIRITSWSPALGPQPTVTDIDTAAPAILRRLKTDEVEATLRERMGRCYPVSGLAPEAAYGVWRAVRSGQIGQRSPTEIPAQSYYLDQVDTALAAVTVAVGAISAPATLWTWTAAGAGIALPTCPGA